VSVLSDTLIYSQFPVIVIVLIHASRASKNHNGHFLNEKSPTTIKIEESRRNGLVLFCDHRNELRRLRNKLLLVRACDCGPYRHVCCKVANETIPLEYNKSTPIGKRANEVTGIVAST
jgi:hypothetical protein